MRWARSGSATISRDGHPRVQRGERILEHDLQLGAQLAHPLGAGARVVLAAVRQAARRRLDQAQHRPAQRRLAATRLADDAERLALVQAERDTVDGVHDPDLTAQQTVTDREVGDEVVDLEQRGAHDSAARCQSSSSACLKHRVR